MNKITGDHIGMLATVMNALALSDAFERNKIPSTVMSGFPIGGGVCEPFDHAKAKSELVNGKVVIFSAKGKSSCIHDLNILFDCRVKGERVIFDG